MSIKIETRPCPTCGREGDRSARFQDEASCLSTHRIHEAFMWAHFGYAIGHLWVDEGVYAAAIKRDDPITDEEALAWLDLAHRREVPIRPMVEGALIDVDPLELPAQAPRP